MEIGQAGGDWTCLLCGRGKYVVETSGPDYEYASVPGQCCLFQCASCGHVSLHPIPEPEEVAALYPPTYYTVNPASPLYLHGYIYQRKIHLDIKRIRSYVNVQKVRSVVDIGCGDAARLFELRKLVPEDAECVGLDLQFQAPLLERARKARIRLVQGSESNLNELQDAAHDLMIMSQILEHLRDPIDVLARLRTKLTPDGILLLETPNRGGLDYRLFRHRYWGGYHLPRHFHLFTKDSLAVAAKRLGYRVVLQGSLPSPGFWILSFRNAMGLHSSHRQRSVFEFLNFSNLIAVGVFTAMDSISIKLGFPTSNQFALLARS